MDYIQVIRKLARSQYYQSIYNIAKEVGSINLFDNQTNFSGLQSTFLYWLRIYDSLYTDLANKEWKYLDDDVIENDIRCDAFIYWRSQIREQQLDSHKQEQKKSNLNFKNPGVVTPFNIDFS